MTINKIIRTIMRDNDVSLLDMAKAVGKKRGNDISARLTTKNMSFDKAIEMLDVLRYKILIVPKEVDVEGYVVESTVKTKKQSKSRINLYELLEDS